MISIFLVCEYVPVQYEDTRILFCRFRMFDEMKKPLGENLALYPLREMARVD